MAEPSIKANKMDEFVTDLFGVDRKKTIRANKCVMMCKDPDMVFRDETSKREYTISGLCQNCQDTIFK